jgi:serine/threonine protein kinase
MPPPVSAENFLDLVRKSNLIPRDKLRAFLEDRPDAPAAPRELADLLVQEGLLTRFQANQLMRGKHRGFQIGKYHVLEPIADGGMGRVFLCQHTAMGHQVAIKLLDPSIAQRDPTALARFQREARAAAQLNHPNIVRTHDIDKTNTHHYLVMDYIEGITLYDLVRREGPLSVEEAVTYVVHVGLGLQHIHENNLVHRDLKPSNLVLDRTGIVKVLDLGLALFRDHRRDNLTAQHDSNAILGTADFLAPEQAMSSDVDIRADIYSLGSVLYFLLTAQFPFGDMPLTRKLLSLHMLPPTPILQHRPGLDNALVQVIGKMMAKKKEDRYRTPLEAVYALVPFAPIEVTLPPLGPDGSPVTDGLTTVDATKNNTKIDWRGTRPPSSSTSRLAGSNTTPPVAARPTVIESKKPAKASPKRQVKKQPVAKGKGWLYGAVIGVAVFALVMLAILFFT